MQIEVTLTVERKNNQFFTTSRFHMFKQHRLFRFLAPCKGMKCSNGGTLDTGTCKCSCRMPFTGDTCEYGIDLFIFLNKTIFFLEMIQFKYDQNLEKDPAIKRNDDNIQQFNYWFL